MFDCAHVDHKHITEPKLGEPAPFGKRAARAGVQKMRDRCMTRVLAVEGMSGSALELLVSRRFGPLFACQFLSAFNDNAVRNALVLMIAYRADAASQLSAQLMIPLAGGLFILPFFLCSATAGQLADQLDKAWLIRLIKLTEIGLMMVAAAGVLLGSTTALL